MCAKCDGLLKKLWLNSKKLIKKKKRPAKVCKKKEGRTLRSGISMKKKKLKIYVKKHLQPVCKAFALFAY